MYYEINVTLNGRHFFATAERSITDQTTFMNMFYVFKEKFPESEGYHITATRIETIGHNIPVENLISKEEYEKRSA